MSDLFLTTPFDILVKDFFNSKMHFQPAHEAKYGHPVDIYEDNSGLHIEVACTGIDKDDVEITVEDSVIKIGYRKDQDVKERSYYTRSISRKAFNLGYKVASRFDLSVAEARFENGLLLIDIPFTKSSKPRTLKIK